MFDVFYVYFGTILLIKGVLTLPFEIKSNIDARGP
jgi:hypothetical protein